MGDKSKGKEKKKTSFAAAPVAATPPQQPSTPATFRAKLSKTARASAPKPEKARPLQPYEHHHRCPACGDWFSHIQPGCVIAFRPCTEPACQAWANRPVCLRRVGRHKQVDPFIYVPLPLDQVAAILLAAANPPDTRHLLVADTFPSPNDLPVEETNGTQA